MKYAIKWGLTSFLAALLVNGTALAGPALQYRGPTNEAPQGLVAPGMDGTIGTQRLQSKSGRVEGDARWEFWWELNRDRYLRTALRTNERLVSGTDADVFYSAEPKREKQLSAEELHSSIRPVLIARLTSSNRDERTISAIALGLAGESGAFSGLRQMLARASSLDRQAAALGLGFLGDPLAIPELGRLLNRAGVPMIDRSKAALGLGFIGGRDAATALKSALHQSLNHRGREAAELQAAIATALGLAGRKESVGVLLRVAEQRENRSVFVRTAAINALGRIGEDAASAALIGLLDDSRAAIRDASAQALGMLKSRQAVPALKTVFTGDGDPAVRSRAAMALGSIGGDGVGDVLVGGLDIRNARVVREFSALALGILGDPAHAPLLRALLHGRQGEGLAGAAAISLGILRDSGAVPALISMSRSARRDHNTRGYAVLALAMLGDPVTRSGVRDLARKPGATQVRRSATMSLGIFPRLSGSRTILASLLEETDPYVRGAAICALGILPRAGAADMLGGIVASRSFSPQAKLDALQALGVLARRGAPSRAEELIRDLNYQSAVPAVLQVARIF